VAVDGRGVQLHNLIAHGLHKMALIYAEELRVRLRS
tara:strand:+ start:531 stop:638 length:108 start_codon:yes stop_codon:yes gene_type:complete